MSIDAILVAILSELGLYMRIADDCRNGRQTEGLPFYFEFFSCIRGRGVPREHTAFLSPLLSNVIEVFSECLPDNESDANGQLEVEEFNQLAEVFDEKVFETLLRALIPDVG